MKYTLQAITIANIIILLIFGVFLNIQKNIQQEEFFKLYYAQVSKDFKEIKRALSQYKNDHEQYPEMRAWSGYYGFDISRPDWIPNLSPQYISQLPRDPRKLTDYSQYMYRSNGEDYKLIINNAFVSEKSKKYLDFMEIDPKRPEKVVGMWTKNAKYW